MTTFPFRAVVRGNTKEGARVRRVRVLQARSFETAWESFEAVYADMSKGLSNVSPSVLPPVGWRVDGTVSAGFAVEH